MKKVFKKDWFSLIVVLPLILIGYQNCGGELQSSTWDNELNTHSSINEEGTSSLTSENQPKNLLQPDSPQQVLQPDPLNKEPTPTNPSVAEETKTEPPSSNENSPQTTKPYFSELKVKVDQVINLRNTTSWISQPSNNEPLKHPNSNSILTVADGYNRAQGLLGLVSVYEATKDNKYLQWAFEKASEIIDSGRQETDDNFLDWYAGKYNPAGKGWNYDHYEWRSAMGVGHVLLSLIRFPNAQASSSANKAKLANFLRDHVWKKWQPGAIENGKGKASNINVSCSYMRARVGVVALALHQYFGDQQYLNYINTKLKEIGDMITRNYKPGVSANLWGRVNDTDVGGSPTPGTVDTAHAGDIAHLFSRAAEFKYEIASSQVMEALSFIFNENIFISESEGFAGNVNGTKGPFRAGDLGAWFKLLPYINQNHVDKIIRWSLKPGNINNGFTSRESRTSAWGALMVLLD